MVRPRYQNVPGKITEVSPVGYTQWRNLRFDPWGHYLATRGPSVHRRGSLNNGQKKMKNDSES